MTKSLTNKAYLERQFYYFTMSDSDSSESHLHKFNKFCNDLLCIDNKTVNKFCNDLLCIDDKTVKDDKAYMFIYSMNLVYELVARTLLYSKDFVELNDLVVVFYLRN